MDLALKDKVVLITGGSRGIGYAVARAFASEGSKVIITSTKKEVAESVAKSLSDEFSIDALGLEQNVASSESSKNVVDSVIEKYSCIDVLVNNAGITNDMLVMQMTDNDWSSVIDTNLSGSFYIIRECTKYMLKRRSGKIINMSSVVGKNGNAAQVNYAASKAGVIGMTKAMAKEFAGRNINVNAIAPGFIETDMTGVLPENVRTKIKEATPLKRFGDGKNVADATLFLASHLSDYITGEVIAVDGGMSI